MEFSASITLAHKGTANVYVPVTTHVHVRTPGSDECEPGHATYVVRTPQQPYKKGEVVAAMNVNQPTIYHHVRRPYASSTTSQHSGAQTKSRSPCSDECEPGLEILKIQRGSTNPQDSKGLYRQCEWIWHKYAWEYQWCIIQKLTKKVRPYNDECETWLRNPQESWSRELYGWWFGKVNGSGTDMLGSTSGALSRSWPKSQSLQWWMQTQPRNPQDSKGCYWWNLTKGVRPRNPQDSKGSILSQKFGNVILALKS